MHKWNFNSFMKVPKAADNWLQWWILNVKSTFKTITRPAPGIVIYTDASTKQWGAYDQTHKQKTNGFWSAEEQNLHINVLELKACQLGIMSFCKGKKNIHVRVYMDNTTSCAYINKYGGKFDNLDKIAREIWFWCIERNIFLSAAHVAGSKNIEADKMSRENNDDLEWSLSLSVFDKLHALFPKIKLDLFASRLNTKCSKYVSRRPEPEAMAVDAFSLEWDSDIYYIFGPFSLTAQILKKMEEDKTKEALVVLPLWPSQNWWPTLTNLIIGQCYLLPRPQNVLSLPHRPERKHPLTAMRLVAFPLSGKRSASKEFRRTLETSSLNHGDLRQENSMKHILNSGYFSVKGKKIPLIHL